MAKPSRVVGPECYVILAKSSSATQTSVKGILKSKSSEWVVIEAGEEEIWIPKSNVAMLVVDSSTKKETARTARSSGGIVSPEGDIVTVTVYGNRD